MVINIVESREQYVNFVRFYQFNIVEDKIFTGLYIDEELTEDDIEAINKGDAVYARRPSDELLKNISVPIFSQNENPLSYKGHLNNDFIYLSDLLFMSFYEKSFEFPNYCIKFRNVMNMKRDIDVLYIGSNRGKPGLSNIVPFLCSFFMKNSFESIMFYDWIEKFVAGCVKKNRAINFYLPIFFQRINQSVRWHRRRVIQRQLMKISEDGYNVTVFGDMILDSKMINYRGNMNYDDIEKYFLRAKIIICTTPNHLSMLNERFVAAVRYGAIPLIEPYPQYMVRSGAHKDFQYNYVKDNLYHKCLGILKNYTVFMTAYDEYSNEISRKYSVEKCRNLYKNILRNV